MRLLAGRYLDCITPPSVSTSDWRRDIYGVPDRLLYWLGRRGSLKTKLYAATFSRVLHSGCALQARNAVTAHTIRVSILLFRTVTSIRRGWVDISIGNTAAALAAAELDSLQKLGFARTIVFFSLVIPPHSLHMSLSDSTAHNYTWRRLSNCVALTQHWPNAGPASPALGRVGMPLTQAGYRTNRVCRKQLDRRMKHTVVINKPANTIG